MEDDTHHSDKLCEICGHVGFKELAKTCSRCHMTHQHVYCMRIHRKVIPNVWICEECLPRVVSPEEELLNTSNIAHQSVSKEQLMDALITAKEVEPSNTTRISPIISLGEPFHHVIEPENLTCEERDLLDVLPNPQMFRSYLPTVKPTWKGGFKFFDTATPGQFYGGFQAQPPCSVRRKAFEVSRKLPLVLQVELLPRCHILADLFGDDCPNFEDIALYFFPSDNIERSKQNNSCLIEFLEVQNFVMTSYIDGVELLIFTSQHLHKGSQRIIKMTNIEYFLWGVFRHVKSDQIRRKVHEELPSLVSPMDYASDDHAQVDNIEATNIDMDIDMEGGRIVGTIDKVVPKQISEKTCGSHEKGDLYSTTEKMSLECKHGRHDHSDVLAKLSEKFESKFTFDHISDKQRKLANIKSETNIPPGFKERSWLSIRIKEEKTELVDQVKDMKEITSLQWASSRGALGACSLEPQKPLEDSNSARSQKVHDASASNGNHTISSMPSSLEEETTMKEQEKEREEGLKIVGGRRKRARVSKAPDRYHDWFY